MGNGVGISSDNPSAEFGRLEKLCKSGYFHQNYEEYLSAVTLAIQTNKLDCLELLIISGNIKLIMPVHLAAKLGKLEPLELLLSAGFPGHLTDKQGRTPLHLTALACSVEVGLVVSLLALSFPQTVQRYDYEGYKPIHFAVVHENTSVIGALLQHGATVNDVTQSGKTVTQLAKTRQSKSTISYLHEVQKAADQRISQEKERKKAKQAASDVSADRIMQVWERFFDNAFKQAGVPMDDDQDNGYYGEDYKDQSYHYYGDDDDMFIAQQKKTKQKSSTSSSSKKNKKKSTKDDHYYIEDKTYEREESLKESKDVMSQSDWFEWIVCYDEEAVDDQSEEAGSYYVIHKQTKEKRWLDDHWRILQRSEHYPFLFESDSETIASWPFPTTLWEVTAYGWLTYYDYYENICWWMNIATNVFEYYLPLGFGDDFDQFAQLNIFPSQDHPDWMAADQSCSTAWMLVIYEDENLEGNQYYLNSITNQSSWDPPSQWEEMKESWNGWIPCAYENFIDEIFW